MISGEGMDRNVVTDGTLKRQNDTVITSQGKTQTGRTVQKKPVVMPVQSFGQQIAVTSHRATTHYSSKENSASRVTEETVNTAKPEMVGEKLKQEPTISFQQQVLEVTEKLQRKRESEPDDFLYCMAVIEEIDALQKNKVALNDLIHGSANHQFMSFIMSCVYSDALCPALKMLEDRISATRCGWIYKRDIDTMARIFWNLIPYDATHRERLANIYRQYIEHELDDMKYLLKLLPEEKRFFDHISKNIEWLTNENSPLCYIPLLDGHTLKEFKKRHKKLLQDAELHIKNAKTSKDQEELDELRKTVPKAITDVWEKRKYYDQLLKQFIEFIDDIKKKDKDKRDHQESLSFLEETTNKFCKEYDRFIGDQHTKFQRILMKLISAATRRVLLKIQDTDNTDPFKKKSLPIIGYLADRGWLYKWCENHYHDCLKPQDRTNTRITHATIDRQFNNIYYLLETKTDENNMLAIEELSKLMLHESDILAMDVDGRLRERIKKAKHECALTLFYPIFHIYDKLSKTKLTKEVDIEMRQHKKEFIKLNPYKFVIDNYMARHGWQWRACSAWHNDIEELINATSFSEDDVNNLLQFKSIAPDVPNSKIFFDLQLAMAKILQFTISDNTGALPIGKVSELSNWVNILRAKHSARKRGQQPQECDEEWKKKYGNTARDRTMTLPGASTKTVHPFAHPGITDASLSTCSCSSHTEQQIAPNMMRPVTALFYMPAPATQQSFQQSVPVFCYTATGQTPAGIKPQSEQPLQAYYEVPTDGQLPEATMVSHSPVYPYPQPAPPYIPASAINQPFQLSAPALCYTATEQPPAGIKPQSEQPLQDYYEVPTDGQLPEATMVSHSPVYPYPQPAPPYIPASAINQPFQLSAPALCYTATEQPPAGIKPQSEQPLQDYYEVPTDGQLPEATMVSHSPVYPYPQPAPPYIPASAINQPFQLSAPALCYTATEQPPTEIRPQPEQPLQDYYEVPTDGQLPEATMVSHSPVYPYPQPAPPYIPASAINQPFQLSAPALCYTATEQPPTEIRLQPEQPLQLQPLSAYHEVPTAGPIPGTQMILHFPVYSYAPIYPHQLAVCENIQSE